MRLKLKILTSLSSTTAEEKDQFNVDPGTLHQITDAVVSGNSRQWKITTGTVDQEIDFGGCSEPNFLMVVSNKQISVKLNGGAAIVVKPPDAFEWGCILLTTDVLDSLTVSNASGYTATVKVYLAGDPA